MLKLRDFLKSAIDAVMLEGKYRLTQATRVFKYIFPWARTYYYNLVVTTPDNVMHVRTFGVNEQAQLVQAVTVAGDVSIECRLYWL